MSTAFTGLIASELPNPQRDFRWILRKRVTVPATVPARTIRHPAPLADPRSITPATVHRLCQNDGMPPNVRSSLMEERQDAKTATMVDVIVIGDSKNKHPR